MKQEIIDFKKGLNPKNTDYATGYFSALSVVEGMMVQHIAEDVVEVVHGRWVNPYIVYLGRPSHDYPCDICHSKLCSAPSKWEGMVPATADMVEVVRCKDCKWRNTRGCPYMNFNAAVRDDSDYCSDGERKDNEQMDLEHCVKKCGCYYLLDFSGMSLRQVVDCFVWCVISDKRRMEEERQ